MGTLRRFIFLIGILLALLSTAAYADTASPIWSAPWNSTPATFNTSTQLRFNITWADGNPLHTLIMEVNRSGTLANHTPSAAQADSFYLNTSTDYLELDEQIDAVGIIVLTSGEMSDLSSGTVTTAKGSSDYNQSIAVAQTAAVTYTIDPDDATDTPAWYLKFDSGSVIYQHNLTFESNLTSDIDTTPSPDVLSDFVDLNLTLLGLTYTISNATWDEGNITLELTGTDNNDVFSLRDSNITNDANGGMPVSQPDNNISDVTVQVVGSNTSENVTLSHISLTWIDGVQDIYVPVGGNLTSQEDDNQLFLDFDIEFTSVQEDSSMENILLQSSGNDEYRLKFTNKAGDLLQVPLYDVDTLNLKHGNENFALHVAEGDTNWADTHIINLNEYFVVSDSAENNTYLVRYMSLDSDEDLIVFEEVGTSSEVQVSYNYIDNATAAADLLIGGKNYEVYVQTDSNDTSILVDFDGNGSLNLDTVPWWYTLYGAKIGVHATPAQGFNITSLGGGDALGAGGEAITVTVTNSTADTTEIGSVGGAVSLQTIGATDDKEDYGVWGTHVYKTYAASGPDMLNITYPDNQTLMQVRYLTGRLLNTYNLTLTDFPAGTHAWRGIANDTSGNTNTSSWFPFTISRIAATLNLTLNATEGNVTIKEGSSIWLNGTLLTGDTGTALELYDNGALLSNTTVPANFTEFTLAGLHNITLLYRQSQNYSTTSVAYWATVLNFPVWSSPWNSTPATFDASAQLRFRTVWTDNTEVGTVLFEVNRSGVLTNHTGSASLETASRFYFNTSTDLLEHDEQLDQVGFTLLTETEVTTLSNGTLNNSRGSFNYTQRLSLPTDAAVTYTVDPDDATDTPAWYLKFDDTSLAYVYNLTFTPALESNISNNNLDDLDNKTITLLGTDYVIVNTVATQGSITLDLMAGAVRGNLSVNMTAGYVVGDTDYYVTLTFVNGSDAKFTVNGVSTAFLSQGETDVLSDSTIIGLVGIGNQSADFFLGATKIRLSDTAPADAALGEQSVMVGSNTVSDVKAVIKADNATTDVMKITEILLTWTLDDDIYIAVGDTLNDQEDDDQVFLNFDLEFASVETDSATETIALSPNGNDEYLLNFTNKANQYLSVPLFNVDELDLQHGNEYSLLHVAEGDGTWTESDTIDAGEYFVISDSAAKNTYYLVYDSLDTTQSTIRFIASRIEGGSIVEQEIDVSYAWAFTNQSAVATLTLGGEDYDVYIYDNATNADILVDLDHNGSLNQGDVPWWYTRYGAKIGVHAAPSDGFNITTEAEGDTIGAGGEVITVTVTNTTANTTEIGTVGGAVTLQTVGSSDNQEDYDVWGTYAYKAYSSSDPDTLTFTYPDNQTSMLVAYLPGPYLNPNTYNLTLSDFPAGTHAWRSIANDTYGNTNTTSWQFFTINKTAPTLSLTLGGTAGAVSIETGSTIGLSGSVTTGDGGAVLTLYLDGTKLTNGTSVSNSRTFSTAGTYNVSLNYTTTQNYTNSMLSYLVTVADAPASSGGGGSGTITTDTSPSATRFIVSVSKETGVDMSISSTEIPVSKIEVEVTDSMTNVEIKVTARDEMPASVDEAPKASSGTSRAVYKYLEIEHKNLAGKIEQATIEFKVTKAWLTNNSIDKSRIMLQRYTGSTWVELPTEIAKETTANVYYNATTTGFSVFAISVKEEETAVEEESGEEELVTGFVTEEPEEPPEQPEAPTEETPDEGAGFPWGWVLGILILVVIAAGSFIVLKLRLSAEMPPAQPPVRQVQQEQPMPQQPAQMQQPQKPPLQLPPLERVSPEQETLTPKDEDNASKIIAYITKCRGRGLPDGSILEQLLKAGYELELVDKCFKRLSREHEQLSLTITDYIRQSRTMGFSDDQILVKLLDEDLDMNLIDECFKRA